VVAHTTGQRHWLALATHPLRHPLKATLVALATTLETPPFSSALAAAVVRVALEARQVLQFRVRRALAEQECPAA
jgi:hypothetical protein